MKYQEIIVSTEKGSANINVCLNRVHFVVKEGPMLRIASAMGGTINTSTDIPEEALEGAGLVAVVAPDGTKAWINPDYVQFYANSDIGVYNLVFLGGTSRVTIQSTLNEIKEILEIA